MSNTYRHKIIGKWRRYYVRMREWYNEGTLCGSSGWTSWPTFPFGPRPIWSIWSNPTQEFRQTYNRNYRHRINQLVRMERYDDVYPVRKSVHWDWD